LIVDLWEVHVTCKKPLLRICAFKCLRAFGVSRRSE
jgi:hypothetical protein